MNPKLMGLGAIVFQAFLALVAGTSWHVPTITIGISLPFCIWDLTLPRMFKWLAFSVAGAMLVLKWWLISAGTIIDVCVIPIWLTRAVAEVLLVAQLWLTMTTKGTHQKTQVGLILLSIFCCFNQRMDSEHNAPFLMLAISCVFVFAWYAHPNRINGTSDKQVLHRAHWVGGIFAIVAANSWLLADVWQGSVTKVQAAIPGWLAETSGRNHAVRQYMRMGTLGGIATEKLTDPMMVALKVYADKPPGYLRGRVFDVYQRGQWRAFKGRRHKWNRLDDKTIVKPMPPVAGLNVGQEQQLFLIEQPDQSDLIRMEIVNDPRRGETYFTPQNIKYIAGVGEFVAVDEHQAIYTGLSTSTPYVAFSSQRASRQVLTESQKSRFLAPLQELESRCETLAESICGKANSTTGKIRSIVDYFRDNYQYSLDTLKVPPQRDPVSYFILEQPPAHCEYFATATVALLRLQNIPSRYVTGYLVTELEDEDEEYWQARNRNAHAWAEAYDEQSQTWRIVESTPGVYLPDDNTQTTQSSVETSNEEDQLSNRKVNTFGWLQSSGWQRFSTNVKTFVPMISIVVLTLGSVAFLQIRRTNIQFHRASPCLTSYQRRLTKIFSTLTKQKLIRQPSETLHRFAVRIRNHDRSDEMLAEYADLLIEYATLRYRIDSSNSDNQSS